MATLFINTLMTIVIHSVIAIATIITLVAVFGTTKKDLINLAKKIGIGFLVYHSDSQKYFYCITKKSAVEWLGSTYADAVMFSNWNKETITIVSRKQQINFA